MLRFSSLGVLTAQFINHNVWHCVDKSNGSTVQDPFEQRGDKEEQRSVGEPVIHFRVSTASLLRRDENYRAKQASWKTFQCLTYLLLITFPGVLPNTRI